MIAPVKQALAFLSEQWPPRQTSRMSKEEYQAMLSKALKSVKQPDNIDIAIIQRQIAEHYALIEDMQWWLDKFLKN